MAATSHGYSYAVYQTHARSHAVSVPVSSGSKPHAFQSEKTQTASLASCHPHIRNQVYVRWYCIDLSNPPGLPDIEVQADFHLYANGVYQDLSDFLLVPGSPAHLRKKNESYSRMRRLCGGSVELHPPGPARMADGPFEYNSWPEPWN